MVMRSNPWYNSQVLAQVGQNLATAIYGDPDAKYKQSADRRAEEHLAMQRSQFDDSRAARDQQEELRTSLAEAIRSGNMDGAAALVAQMGGSFEGLLGTDVSPAHARRMAELEAQGENQMTLQGQRHNDSLALALRRSELAAQQPPRPATPPFLGATESNNLLNMLDGSLFPRFAEAAGLPENHWEGDNLPPSMRGQFSPEDWARMTSDFSAAVQSGRSAIDALNDTLGGVLIGKDPETGEEFGEIKHANPRAGWIRDQNVNLPGARYRPQQGGQGGIPQVTSSEEYDALPSGAVFIDTADGRQYRKP